MKSIRLLAECVQGFERFAGDCVRQSGLTHAQFDIIATLGNTPGMSYKELGSKTLITKGTMTGVIERLEQKGLVERERSVDDRRSYFIRLTPSGVQVFNDVFPRMTSHGAQLFAQYSDADFTALEAILSGLKHLIVGGSERQGLAPDPLNGTKTKEIS